MSRDRPKPPGFIMALILSILFLLSSACADVAPTVDPSMNMHAEDEATANELRASAKGGGGCSRTLSRPTCGTTSRQHMEKTDQLRLVMLSPNG